MTCTGCVTFTVHQIIFLYGPSSGLPRRSRIAALPAKVGVAVPGMKGFSIGGHVQCMEALHRPAPITAGRQAGTQGACLSKRAGIKGLGRRGRAEGGGCSPSRQASTHTAPDWCGPALHSAPLCHCTPHQSEQRSAGSLGAEIQLPRTAWPLNALQCAPAEVPELWVQLD